jgi:hypothetical protein
MNLQLAQNKDTPGKNTLHHYRKIMKVEEKENYYFLVKKANNHFSNRMHGCFLTYKRN